jgi:hypothetical protein
MAEIVTMLVVVDELLVGLTANLVSATADEIPALCEEAEKNSATCPRVLHGYRTDRPSSSRGSGDVARRLAQIG